MLLLCLGLLALGHLFDEAFANWWWATVIGLLGLVLPLLLAWRWALPRRWWPADGSGWAALGVLFAFVFLVNYWSLAKLAEGAIEYDQWPSLLFAAAWQRLAGLPLFLFLLLPLALQAKRVPRSVGLVLCALSYVATQALLGGEGLSLLLAGVSFLALLLLYLMTQSAFWVMLAELSGGFLSALTQSRLAPAAYPAPKLTLVALGAVLCVLLVMTGLLDRRARGAQPEDFWIRLRLPLG